MALFNKLIHLDETFDNCERFLILKEHLGSKALEAVENFDVTDENYPKVIARLKECFNKKSLMFEEHVGALFGIPKVTKSSSGHLRTVVNSVNAHVSAMRSLGDYKDIANTMLIHIVMERVDVDTQIKWEESVDYSKMSTWDECSAILTRRCENLDARESKLGQVNSKLSHFQKDQKFRHYNPTTLSVGKAVCHICHGSGHELADCSQFKKLSIQERSSAVKKARVCFRCLKKGHVYKDCTALPCSKCKLPHHQLLHRDVSKEHNIQTADNLQSTSTQSAANHVKSSSVLNVMGKPEVLLATAVVLVKDSCGKYHRVRAVLDAGAQVNLICEHLAQQLLLKKKACKINASLAGDVPTNFKKETMATIKSSFNEYEVCLEFYVLPKITSKKPCFYHDVSMWNIPKNIHLADPMFNQPGRYDLLIGAEVFFELLSVGRICLGDNLPKLRGA